VNPSRWWNGSTKPFKNGARVTKSQAGGGRGCMQNLELSRC